MNFNEILDTVVRYCHPIRVILYGEKMTGEHMRSANLCIIVDMMCDKTRLLQQLYLEINAPFPVQVLLYNAEEWNKLRKDAGSYASAIEKKGTILYGETTQGEH